MDSEVPMLRSQLTGVRTNAAILALAGVLVSSVIALQLGLPQRIRRGEDGQAAIQLLDAMRRPFLEIKAAETRLLHNLEVESANRELAIAVGSADSLLRRYQAVAAYSEPLSRHVAGLADTFRDWVAVERRLFSCVGGRPAAAGATPSASGLVPDLASAAAAFLRTMNELGAGEAPIHLDIAQGRNASRMLQALVAILLAYLTGLVYWLQRRSARQESALLQDRLRAEESARAAATALSEALEKVLSGFIPICASCKRVRVQESEWTPVEVYVTNKTDATFSHGVCPECKQRLYGDFLSRRSRGPGGLGLGEEP
jgi:hypothetical protein